MHVCAWAMRHRAGVCCAACATHLQMSQVCCMPGEIGQRCVPCAIAGMRGLRSLQYCWSTALAFIFLHYNVFREIYYCVKAKS